MGIVALSFFFNSATFAQEQTVTGSIIDQQSGESLPGVNILVKGTDLGTSSNLDGDFQLNVPSLSDTLVVSFIGYQTLEVPIQGRTVINISLEPSVITGDELVVIGYGEQSRRDLTGSVSSVSSSEFEEQTITSVDQALQGRAAGVQVTNNSGAPGGDVTVRIRGNNSIQGGNQPLFVIDGFPITGGLNSVDPNNIESIEILKDASATAIYGARGANGVVLVTTKRGTRGTSQINFNSYFGIQEVRKKVDLLNAREYAQIANERARNDGVPLVFPNIDNVSPDTDWQEKVLDSAPVQNYSLNFSGGDQNNRYSVSGSWFDQEGIVIGSKFERGSLRANLDRKVNDFVDLKSSLMLSRSINDMVEGGVENSTMKLAVGAPPPMSVFDDEGNFVRPRDFFSFVPGNLDNPVATLDATNRLTTNRVIGNLQVSYETPWITGLLFEGRIGADYNDATSDNYTPSTMLAGQPAGSAFTSTSESNSWLAEAILKYENTIFENHELDLMTGYTWQMEENRFLSAGASGFVTDALENNNLGAGQNPAPPNSGTSEWTLLSGIARINYIIADKYLFTFTGRADGSSRFGSGNKWGFFPSGAVSWRLSEEDFISNLNLFSDLKVRASWGLTGNQEIGLFQSLQRIQSTALVFADALQIGFAPANLPNPELKWESTEQINIGVDFSFLNDRLRFASDYYKKTTDDLLALVELPPSTGFETSIQNIGEIENKGWEFALNADIVSQRDFQWSLNANISTNENEVKKLAGGNEFFGPTATQLVASVHLIREGLPLSSFYGFVEDGIKDNGQINYIDINGDGEITDEDRTVIGNPYPDFTYGLTSNLSYKNFDFSFLIQGVQGNDIFNANLINHGNGFLRGRNQIDDVLDHWSPDNPDPNAKFPIISSNTLYRMSDRFIKDGSYLRLKNIQLGYNIPVDRLELSGIRSAKIYISGDNILTLTNYGWYDPEINNFGSGDLRVGSDIGFFPRAKTYKVGINLVF